MIEAAEWVDAHEHPAAFAGYLSKREKFQRPPHVELLSQSVAHAVLSGGGRFIVTMPPRHGKSTLCSAWLPFWFLNLFPDKSVMLVSYGAEFAKRWGLRVRRLASVHADRTLMRIAPESRSAGEWETTEAGGMKSLGIQGDATGRGADLLIIDDPVKNSEEARSEVMQQKTWEFWQETLRTRVEPGGTILVVQTRWHESDLAGRLLDADNDKTNQKWQRIDFPAIAEHDDVLGRKEGEALWPERYPLDALLEIRDDKDGVGVRAFASLYQQRPSPEGGGMFRRKDFRYFTDDGDHYVLHAPEGKNFRVLKAHCRAFQTADTAMTERQTSDYTVITTFVLTPQNHLLVLDVARDRLEIPDQWPYVQAAVRRGKQLDGYRWLAVEDKGSGIGMIQLARKLGMPIRALKANTDKVTRATPASVWYENGMVYHRTGAVWLDAFEHELQAFPNGAHDDQVDTVAYAVMESQRRPAEPIVPDEKAAIAPKPRGIFDNMTDPLNSGGREARSMWRH